MRLAIRAVIFVSLVADMYFWYTGDFKASSACAGLYGTGWFCMWCVDNKKR